MNLNTYTEKSREAVFEGQSIASRHGQSEVMPEHVLLALLDQQNGVVPQIVIKLGRDVGNVRAAINDEINKLPRVGPAPTRASPTSSASASPLTARCS